MRRQEKKQVLVIGLGRFGSAIAQTLCEDGVQVMGIDRRMDLVEEMRDSLTQAIQADSMDRDAMAALGVGEFETAFVTMGSDVKASCVTTMLLKELGVKHVVAKASDDFHGRMLEKLGADKIVFPERDMGKRIAHNLVSGNLLEYIELSPDFSMAEILADPAWSGRTLSELHLRDQLGINVVAVRSGEKFNPLPTSGTVIQEGDIMLVVAGEETLLGLNKRK
ncbi:MAG: potassium channel family protein [Candidatus Faecivicinus sp.]